MNVQHVFIGVVTLTALSVVLFIWMQQPGPVTHKEGFADAKATTKGTMVFDTVVGETVTGTRGDFISANVEQEATIKTLTATNIQATYTASGQIVATDKLCVGDKCLDKPLMMKLIQNQGKGDVGATGPVGPEGPQGVGISGVSSQGGDMILRTTDGKSYSVKVPTGPAGPEGPTGPKGDKGVPGDRGATGAMGPAGPAGLGVNDIASIETGVNKLIIKYNNKDIKPLELSLANVKYITSMDYDKASNTLMLKYSNGEPYNITLPVQNADGKAIAGAPGPAGPPGPQGAQGPPGPTGSFNASGGHLSVGPQGKANLHTNRGRVAFSTEPTDPNHTIYNNYANIDGEGAWDGMKMNVFAGLDVRVGNAGAKQHTTALYVRNDGNVGVGTKDPRRALHVIGEQTITPNAVNGSTGFLNVTDAAGNAGDKHSFIVRGLKNNGNEGSQLNTIWLSAAQTKVDGKLCIDDVCITKNEFMSMYKDGSSASRAAPSAKYIQETFGIVKDGVYWINLPVVGPKPIYCIMNPACAGGGWMMAIKATRGTTFNYSSNYWTAVNTLNPNDTTRNDADAKFDTMNYYPATDWMAIFPDVVTGGDVPGGYSGWTWVENNATGTTIPVIDFFKKNTQVTKLSRGYVYPATNPTPLESPKWDARIWSTQAGFHWYGLNYKSAPWAAVRWGFAWNNENEQASNDVQGGIGMEAQGRRFSAGDVVVCCQDRTGVNRSMRFEWYVR